MIDQEIATLIPHRPPFLWVDRIIEKTDTVILTEKCFPEDLDIFKGHYPQYPLLPGVILCEAIFQTGALLLADRLKDQEHENGQKIPVLVKIIDARFKRPVRPGENVRMKVSLTEEIASVSFLKGTASVENKITAKTSFSCALTPR